jgi:exodeoxyribonuclease VII small subunit
MSAKDADKATAPQPTFEEALALLEIIVSELEEGQAPLAEGLARYEQGIKLLRQCYQQLEQVQRRIEVLNRVDSEGGAQCEPYDDRALSLEEKAASRGKRRTRGADFQAPSSEDEIDGPRRLF